MLYFYLGDNPSSEPNLRRLRLGLRSKDSLGQKGGRTIGYKRLKPRSALGRDTSAGCMQASEKRAARSSQAEVSRQRLRERLPGRDDQEGARQRWRGNLTILTEIGTKRTNAKSRLGRKRVAKKVKI